MDRRIVVYENNSQTGKGESVFQFCNHVNEKNNILERDYASFILQAEKSKNRPINAMLVAKYIIASKQRFNPFVELYNYIFHKNDFQPYIAPLPEHVEVKQEFKSEVLRDLDRMGF